MSLRLLHRSFRLQAEVQPRRRRSGQRPPDRADPDLSLLRPRHRHHHRRLGGNRRLREVQGRGRGRSTWRTPDSPWSSPNCASCRIGRRFCRAPFGRACREGPFSGSAAVAGGAVFLCCGGVSVGARLARESAADPVPARRGLAWRPYLWSAWDAVYATTAGAALPGGVRPGRHGGRRHGRDDRPQRDRRLSGGGDSAGWPPPGRGGARRP